MTQSSHIPPANDPNVVPADVSATDNTEKIYYSGSPLLRGEIGKATGFGLLAIALVAGGIWWWAYGSPPHWGLPLAMILLGPALFLIPIISLKRVRYRITNYRIDIETGLIGKRIDTLELWHVDDLDMVQSVFDRILGVGTITIRSADQTTPNLDLSSLPEPRKLFETLKQRVIAVKRQRGVIKMDGGGGDFGHEHHTS